MRALASLHASQQAGTLIERAFAITNRNNYDCERLMHHMRWAIKAFANAKRNFIKLNRSAK
eukprot:5102078-Pleurochrysis_carterae.AAC.8